MSEPTLWDDPQRDYRKRYAALPDQFAWELADWPRIQFDGYMRLVLDLLPPPPASVLDVGCGPGFAAKRLCEHGYRVTGLDFNERGIAFGRILVPEADLSVGDVRLLEEMRPLHRRFDAAIHIEVMEHIPPEFHPQVLRGIHCTLVEGGVLVLSTPSTRLAPGPWDYKHFDRTELLDLVSSSGFEVTDCLNNCEVNVLTSPFLWRLLANKYYDARLLRRVARTLYLRRYNIARGAASAGRFVIRAVKRS